MWNKRTLHAARTSCHSLCSLSLVLMPRNALKSLVPSSWYLSHRYSCDAVRWPKAIPPPDQSSSFSQLLLTGKALQPGGLLLNSRHFIRVLVLGDPTVDAVSRCGLRVLSRSELDSSEKLYKKGCNCSHLCSLVHKRNCKLCRCNVLPGTEFALNPEITITLWQLAPETAACLFCSQTPDS